MASVTDANDLFSFCDVERNRNDSLTPTPLLCLLSLVWDYLGKGLSS